MDLAKTISYKYPAAKFTVGDTYESLNWLDNDIAKPTEIELKTAWLEYQANRQKNNIKPILSNQDLFNCMQDIQSGFNAIKGFLMMLPDIKKDLQNIKEFLESKNS